MSPPGASPDCIRLDRSEASQLSDVGVIETFQPNTVWNTTSTHRSDELSFEVADGMC
jgi:hypothetical protein